MSKYSPIATATVAQAVAAAAAAALILQKTKRTQFCWFL